MNVLIRADSSSIIGTGHIMRDLVLASQYCRDDVSFATQNLPNNINHKIIEAGYELHTIKDNSFSVLDRLIKKLNIDMLINDHYDIGYEFEKKLKTNNPSLKILSFDDTYEKHYCDILLNHNVSADELKYFGKLPQDCELRCGSKYTLLREEFLIEKAKPKKTNNKTTVFIAMGGADHTNINIDILKVLNSFEGVLVNLVTTTANQNLDSLKQYCENKEWVNLYINSNQIAKLMKQSDFAIVTPSVTVNEIIFMELPFIAVMTAENQVDMLDFIKKKRINALEKFDSVDLKLCIEKQINKRGK